MKLIDRIVSWFCVPFEQRPPVQLRMALERQYQAEMDRLKAELVEERKLRDTAVANFWKSHAEWEAVANERDKAIARAEEAEARVFGIQENIDTITSETSRMLAAAADRVEKAELERDTWKSLHAKEDERNKRLEMDVIEKNRRLADLERWREQAGLIPLSVRMPAFDEGLRVLVYTQGVDFNGAQFFDVRADDLYQPVGEVEAHATHWMPRPLPEPPPR